MDKDEFSNWLEAQSERTCLGVGVRAALRSIPLAAIVDAQPDLPSAKEKALFLLNLRCMISASVVWARAGDDIRQISLSVAKKTEGVRAYTGAHVSALTRSRFAARLAGGYDASRTTMVMECIDPNHPGFYDASYSDTDIVPERMLLEPISAPLERDMQFRAYQARSQSVFETGPEWSFWSRWYARAMAGNPLPWDLQREVALIPDEIWEQGPEAVAERITEIEDEWAVRNFPQPEELLQQEDGRFEVRPLPFDEETFLDRIFTDLNFAVTLAVDSNSNDFNPMCTAYKYLRHTSENCRDDPNAIEQNFGIARSIIETNIAKSDYVSDASLSALADKLERYELQMRADHPQLRDAFERRLAQKLREAEEPLRQQISEAIHAEEERTTGRLKAEMALDAETVGSVASIEAQARALRRAYARSAMMNIIQRSRKLVHRVEGSTPVKAGKIVSAGHTMWTLVQWVLSLLP